MINNGIIVNGNNNVNIINNNGNYQEIQNELLILLQRVDNLDDYKVVSECINYSKNNDSKSIVELIKKLSTKALSLIKELGLNVLSELIIRNIWEK